MRSVINIAVWNIQ